MLFIFYQTCLGVKEMIGFQARQMLLGFCVMHIYPCLITCDIFERNAGFLSSQSRKFWHVLTQLSCSSLGRQDKNLAATQCIFELSSKMVRIDPNEIPNMLATSQLVVLLFLGTIPSLYPYFLGNSCKSMSGAFGIFSRDHTNFEHRKPFKNLFSSHCALCKTTIKSFKSFCGAFPQFKAKFDALMLFYQGCHFLDI